MVFSIHIIGCWGKDVILLVRIRNIIMRKCHDKVDTIKLKSRVCYWLTTPNSPSNSTSFSNCLGYLSKSSPPRNCAGFTNMEATTISFSARAALANDKWPNLQNTRLVYVD